MIRRAKIKRILPRVKLEAKKLTPFKSLLLKAGYESGKFYTLSGLAKEIERKVGGNKESHRRSLVKFAKEEWRIDPDDAINSTEIKETRIHKCVAQALGIGLRDLYRELHSEQVRLDKI